MEDCVFLSEGASVFPDHAHFLPTEASVLDRHAEEFLLFLQGSDVIGQIGDAQLNNSVFMLAQR